MSCFKRIIKYLGRTWLKFWDCIRQKGVLQNISDKWFLSLVVEFVTKYWWFVSERKIKSKPSVSTLLHPSRLAYSCTKSHLIFLSDTLIVEQSFLKITFLGVVKWFLGQPFSTLYCHMAFSHYFIKRRKRHNIIWYFPTIFIKKRERGSPNIIFRSSLKKQFVCIGKYEFYSDLCFIGFWNKLAKLNVNAWFKTLHGPLTTV